MIATLAPNVPLLKITLSHVVMHMRQWDQGAWSIPTPCGTAHCYGGWAIILHGAHFLRLRDDSISTLFVVPKPGDDLGELTVGVIDGERVVVAREYARHICRLTGEQADSLFYALNEIDDLHQEVRELCAGVPA